MHTDAETFVFQGTVVAVQKSMSQSDFAFAPARDDVVFAPFGAIGLFVQNRACGQSHYELDSPRVAGIPI